MTTAVAPPVRMSEDACTALLAYIASLDPRMIPPDPETARIRARAWWRILQDVDPVWAQRYVEHAYSQLRDFSVTVAEIRHEWLLAAEVDETAELREESHAPGGRASQVVMDWLRACLVAGKALPIPEGVGRISPKLDALQRRCTYHALCACPHTHCRAGWEDAPHVVEDAQGRQREAVKRCDHCRDALLMAEERGIAKRPHGHGRRR